MRPLTDEEYVALLEHQDIRCAICNARCPIEALKTRLAVDHDHETGEVRGLLCMNCNTTLGLLHDDHEWLWRAAEYLEHPPSRRCWEGEPRWWPNSPGAAGFDLREDIT